MEAKNIKKEIKLIQTRKFKEHMNIHAGDFIQPFDLLVSEIESVMKDRNIKEDFVETVVTFSTNTGYSYINKINNKKDVIYAKRKGRNLYSKFELNREKVLTNKCVVVLSKNKYRENEYYLITMFPGEYAIKEAQDPNIKTEEQRNKSLRFWEENAFVFDRELIQEDTITSICPY